MEIRTKQISKKELGALGQECFKEYEDHETVAVMVTFVKDNNEIKSGIVYIKDFAASL